MLFQSLRREVAQDPKRKQVRLLSLTSMHTSLSDHICSSPRALSDCSTPASDSVRSIRRYRSSSSIGQLRAESRPPPSRRLPPIPGYAQQSNFSRATTTTASKWIEKDYDDTTAPPYTPTSFTSSTPCTSYASSSTAQFATNKKHPYGEDASPVSPASGLTSVPNYEEYDASGIPFSPVTASFPDLSNGNLGRSHFFEYSQPIIIKNCFTVCCERCAIERVEWNSSASLSTPSSSPKYAHHSTCDQPNGSTYFCRTSTKKADALRKRRICRLLLPQILVNPWKNWNSKHYRDCRKATQYAAPTYPDMNEPRSFFDDRQSFLQRAQSVLGKAVQSVY